MPKTLDANALAALGGPIAAELLPGWRITWVACSQEQLDQLIPGALAVCRPVEDTTPTREMATVYVLADWPDSESIAETLWHELTHARLADLVAMVPSKDTAAAVLVEEKIVERLGVLLARIPLAARRAVARALAAPRVALSQPVRARLSALAPRARSGGTMDAETIKKMIAALKSGDGDAALAMLEEALVKMAPDAGSASPAAEPDGDELGKVAAPADAAPGGGPPPMDDQARKAARKGVQNVETPEQKRARLAREEDEAITAFRRQTGKDELIGIVRARLAGNDGLPAVERRILAAPDFMTAKMVADVAMETGGSPPAGTQRARSGVEHQAPPAGPAANGACPWTAEGLKAEGFSEALAAEVVGQWTIPIHGPKLAQDTVAQARARLAPGASPWMPKAPAAQKVS